MNAAYKATPFPEDRARELAARLQREVRGEVRFDDGSRALYATDASNYRQVPIGVVIPRTVADIVATVALCREYDAPILARGGGTSLAGQCCNVAVVIDTSKYVNRVLTIDPQTRRARVEPGCVLDHLRSEAERYHLTFGPDPSTHNHNTLGGMIGNNSCGVHSVMAGRTSDNVESLDVLTYDGLRLRVGPTSDLELQRSIAAGGRRGEIYAGLERLRDRYADLIRQRFPKIPRRVSGFGLDQLLPENGFNVARALVGTEGTCVLLLEAEVRLVTSPRVRVVLLLGYPDIYHAGDAIPAILETNPIGVEGLDQRLVDHLHTKHLHLDGVQLLPAGHGWLLVEYGGATREEAVANAGRLIETFKRQPGAPAMRLLTEAEQQERIWKVRESGLGATAYVPGEPDTWEGWEDSAVPPEHFGAYLRDFDALLHRYGYRGALYGHFGDGCLHTRISFDLKTAPGIHKWRQFLNDAAELVVRYHGSLSGEHGDGQSRAALLPKMYGEELVRAFAEFKGLWDPKDRLNPGKVVSPYPIVSNLRLQAPERRIPLKTHFAFKSDRGSFARATLRCVGVGECRRETRGVMCPSYRATHEEMHSTRGRARLLFEMLHQGALKQGWRSDAVRDALDLCLSCKGCKHDCPVNVDMATYKAEFSAHYYEGRLRPRSAYAFGLIYWWSRLASYAPSIVNGVTQSAWGGPVAKRVANVAPQRRIPEFARRPFTAEYRQRTNGSGERTVLLWPDTFNNYFHPDTLHAAVAVLEHAGFHPIVPARSLCCGRPLYAWGWLDRAEKLLRQTLDTLAPFIDAGVPVVGIEPACLSVFRDELVDLFPESKRARRLSEQTSLLSEFLEQRRYQPPVLPRKALMQLHCHHHALFDVGAPVQVLRRAGVDVRLLDAGCCGMAGEFGFEADHYEVAMKAGEHALLPAVRAADRETLVVSNGFSCREQIVQATGRETLHPAQVLAQAIAAERGELP
ncbi:MAG: FAD-binding and (Fe-S)-binding domain-containing protein [Sulfurifustaceae bacterium]